MPEPLTTSLVLEELRKLHTAFPQNVGMRSNPSGTAEVYRNGLRGLSGDAVRAAADRAIQDGEFFPKVAKLRELATAWMRHNQPAGLAAAVNHDDTYCGLCRTKALWRSRWRPRVDDERRRERIMVDAEHVALEHYTRLLCECAVPCMYAPIDETASVPMMRVRDIGIRTKPAERDHAAD